MQQFPHHYSVVAKADTQGDVALAGERLPPIPSAPPTEFGGPGDRWSPETLLVAAVADCFVLTFRGIASVSRFAWVSLECSATGTVDRIDRVEYLDGFLRLVCLQMTDEPPSGLARELAELQLLLLGVLYAVFPHLENPSGFNDLPNASEEGVFRHHHQAYRAAVTVRPCGRRVHAVADFF